MRLSFFLSLSSRGGYIDVYASVYTRTTTAVVCVGILVVCSRATVNRNKRRCDVVKALYQHPFLRRYTNLPCQICLRGNVIAS